jgi:hypothetical protein
LVDYPKFSDFAVGDGPLDGEKMKLKDVLGIEILVTGYNVKQSRFKDENYLTLQFTIGEKICVLFTGSGVLTDQITKYADKIPFLSKIQNFGKYYAFT